MAGRSLISFISQLGFLTRKASRVHCLATPSHRALHFKSSSPFVDIVDGCSSRGGHWKLPGTERMGLQGRQAACCVVSAGGGALSHHGIQSPLSWCAVRGYAKKAKKDKVVKGGKKKMALSAEELEGVLDLPKLQSEMHLVAEDLKQQMIQQVSIRTNIGAYDNLPVKTEDGLFPLVQLGQVVQKSPTLILVNLASSPQYIKAVKEALGQSGLNVNPQQDGTTIFIPLPKMTREHREGLAKTAKMIHDKAKTRLRDIHNKYVKKVRAVKDHHSEDIVRAAQDLVLEEMHSQGQRLDAMLSAKQEELLGGK